MTSLGTDSKSIFFMEKINDHSLIKRLIVVYLLARNFILHRRFQLEKLQNQGTVLFSIRMQHSFLLLPTKTDFMERRCCNLLFWYYNRS